MSVRWRSLLAQVLCMMMATSPSAIHAAESTWPPSAGLLVGEVVTGGATGSDEYVELYNAGDAPVSLAGLELAYASASGKTVTRKHTWTQGWSRQARVCCWPTRTAPMRRLLTTPTAED